MWEHRHSSFRTQTSPADGVVDVPTTVGQPAGLPHTAGYFRSLQLIDLAPSPPTTRLDSSASV